ncbi:G-type lectin S-receptor-like serine/threonine-protein kinase, partial [Mucuna pruriens]
MRLHVIGGIARVLVWRIIHIDLKTRHLLLDENMNLKISDFGLAPTLWGDQIDANTNKFAYYAFHPLNMLCMDISQRNLMFSVLYAGRKKRFFHPEHFLNLLGHAWRLWTEGRPKDLMDAFLGKRCTSSEAIGCIHVALSCVQYQKIGLICQL